MSLQRTTHLLRPATRTLLRPRYASTQAEKPQPKILNEAPPEKNQQSEEVRKHNDDFDRRAENQVTREDGKKESNKVDPKYWAGSQAGDKKGGVSEGSG